MKKFMTLALLFLVMALFAEEEKIEENYQITFLEFGSTSCIPCKKMEPILENIKEKYKEKVKVVFHNVRTDEGSEMAKESKVRMIPTQIFLDKDNKEIFRHEGFFPQEKIEKLLDKNLEK